MAQDNQKERLEQDLESLEQEKVNLQKEVQKFQQMSNNAKKMSGLPSGTTERARNYDKQASNNLSLRYREELNNTLKNIKDVEERIRVKKTEIEQSENGTVENKTTETQTEQKMAKLTKEQILRMVESQEPIRMSKRELIENITGTLLSEDINDDIRRKIESGETDYSEYMDPETVKKMSKDVMDSIKANLESRGVEPNLDNAQALLSQSLVNSLQKEARHKRELEQLAIKLVSDEYNIPEGAVDFEVEITGHPQLGGRSIQKTGLKMKKGDKPAPQGKTAEELKPNVTKRRLMNAMMHGAARKGQNLFHAASDELRRIDPGLVNDYSKIMAANDYMYWALDDSTIARESESGTHAGQVKVSLSGPKPKIIAEGMTFPFLLHELTKGVLELISLHGLDVDKETRDYVLDKTDNLESEPWDIRLGARIWEKLLDAMDVDALPYKAQIFTSLSSLPPSEFNNIVNGLLNDSPEAIQELKDIVFQVIKEMNEEEVEQAMTQYREPEPDEETPAGGEEEVEDDILKGLLQPKEEEDNPETWSKRELEDARDEALDNGDYKAVAYIQSILDKKFPS